MNCHICYQVSDGDSLLKINNNNDCYCVDCMNSWIDSLNLSIDIHLADLDEWIQTGLNDKFNDNETIRLRNPKTNMPLSEEELRKIYNYIKVS
jgi:hypothetical protein